MNASTDKIEKDLMDYVLGFSKVISLLSTSNKPIVGHNIFLDTVLLHNQFIGPLPKSYVKYKENINGLFPKMFDTKYMSHEMSKKLSFDEVWKSNALQE